MNEANKTLIKEAVGFAGKQMEGKMPPNAYHSTRNPYAHLWKSIKDTFGRTYAELPDALTGSVLALIERERLIVARGFPTADVYTTHDLHDLVHRVPSPKKCCGGCHDPVVGPGLLPIDEEVKQAKKSSRVIRITLKDPDGFSEAVAEAVAESLEDIDDDDEKEALDELRQDKMNAALEKWVTYGEYVTLEFDLDAGTAKVLPAK